jgi:glutamate-5-semialdehyde dehydrogenase
MSAVRNKRAMTPTDIPAYMAHVGTAARHASDAMARAPLAARNAALIALARLLRSECRSATRQPGRCVRGRSGRSGRTDRRRLRLAPQIIDTVAEGCEQLSAMPDPVGEISGVQRGPAASVSAACACRSASSAWSSKAGPT